jgi:transcription elongation GreA/GreB family factor
MTSNAIATTLTATSRPSGLGHVLATLRERLGRFAVPRVRESAASQDTVEAGSNVRIFAVEALREIALVVAPEGRSSTTPGIVSANSTLGRALLGARAGETCRWESPSGTKRLRVVAIEGRIGEGGWRTPAGRP